MYLLSEEDRLKIPVVKIARDFSSALRYGIPNNPQEIPYSAKAFRDLFLKEFDNQEAWQDDNVGVILDFRGVERLSPSFAYHAFAYFRKYAQSERIMRKFHRTNITSLQKQVIDLELELYPYPIG